jgi:tetratricopeptide (TPR) repeat protein
MKRTLINTFILLTLIFLQESYALSSKSTTKKAKTKRTEKLLKGLMKEKMYYSAALVMNLQLKKGIIFSPKMKSYITPIILKVGVESFFDIDNKTLSKQKDNGLNFVLGLKFLKFKKYKTAIKYLNRIHKDSRLYPETQLSIGTVYDFQKKYKKATLALNKCIEKSTLEIELARHVKLKRYFTYLKESCQLHIGRSSFQRRHYTKSIKDYDTIAKTSYRWPHTLIEKAWANYHLKDYNRTLGLVVTYKSPLLSSYFYPESEYLRALSYYKLCLWDDSLTTIAHYYKFYKSKSDSLRAILDKESQSTDFFYNLTNKELNQAEKLNPYMRNLLNQIKKTVKYSVISSNIKNANKELVILSKKKKRNTKTMKRFKSNLLKEIKEKKRVLNHFVKRNMYNFINQMHKYSYDLFLVKLEILSKKRELVYQNKLALEDRSRGDLESVERKENQFFWNFNGAFWADELGDYSFGLKSKCEDKNEKSIIASNN